VRERAQAKRFHTVVILIPADNAQKHCGSMQNLTEANFCWYTNDFANSASGVQTMLEPTWSRPHQPKPIDCPDQEDGALQDRRKRVSLE